MAPFRYIEGCIVHYAGLEHAQQDVGWLNENITNKTGARDFDIAIVEVKDNREKSPWSTDDDSYVIIVTSNHPDFWRAFKEQIYPGLNRSDREPGNSWRQQFSDFEFSGERKLAFYIGGRLLAYSGWPETILSGHALEPSYYATALLRTGMSEEAALTKKPQLLKAIPCRLALNYSDYASLSPDGKSLAVVMGGEIDVFESYQTGKFKTLPAGRTVSLSFSPIGRLLATRHERKIYIWDLSFDMHVEISLTSDFYSRESLAFSPNSKQLSVELAKPERQSPDIGIYDSRTGESVSILSGHGGTISHNGVLSRIPFVAWCQDEDTLVSGGEDGQVIMWHGDQKTILGKHEYVIASGAISTRCDYAATCGAELFIGKKNILKIWDLTQLKCIETIELGSKEAAVASMSWSLDGSKVLMVCGGDDKNLWLWSGGRTARKVNEIEGRGHVLGLNARRLLSVTTRGQDEAVEIWDTSGLIA